jgi:4-amino-4-deoxy-L-arabinose transferase-like glycosyltransferase
LSDLPALPTFVARPRRLEWLALAVILILAAALRLGMPGIVEFKRDEANLSRLALDMARGEALPLLGIVSSVGVPNAPFSVYVIVPPFLLSSDPILATGYVALLNVIAVLLAYALARRYYGPLAAVIAGLCFAASPWAVIFSRKIWAQDILPLFIVLCVWTGLLGFLEGKRRAQFLHLPLLFITGQIHYVTFVLIPISAYLILRGRKRLTRAFWLSIPLALLTVIPFAVGIMQAAAPILSSLMGATATSRGDSGLTLTAQALHFAVMAVGGTDIHSLTGAQGFQRYLAGVPNAYPLFDGLAVTVIGSGVWLAVRSVRRRDARTPIDVTILLWLCITPLAFSVTWTEVQVHYMIPILPAAFIALGAAGRDLQASLAGRVRVRRAVTAVGAAALVAVVALQTWLVLALFNFVSAHATPGGFGTPLAYYAPLREAILARRPSQVLARLDGQAIGFDEAATVWDFLLADVPARRFLADGIEVFPAEPALYLESGCADVGETGSEHFPMRPDLSSGAPEACYTLRADVPRTFDPASFTPLAVAPFEVGARLIGYDWSPEEGCLATAWTVEGPAVGLVGDQFSVSVHFVDAAGEQVVVADASFWLGRYWRAGDVIVRRFCLTPGSPGAEAISAIAGVRVGLYTFDETPEGRRFFNVPSRAADGQPTDTQITIRFD